MPLNYTALVAIEPKLTRATFTAVVDIHSKRLRKRVGEFRVLGEVALAHATFLYGASVREALWLALRPQRVDAALAAEKDQWLAQVVGMLVAHDLAQALITMPAQLPLSDHELSQDEQQWSLAHHLPRRVGAWVFHEEMQQATGWALLQARQPHTNVADLAKQLALPKVRVKQAVQVLMPAMAAVPTSLQVATGSTKSAQGPQPQVKPQAAVLQADPKLLASVKQALKQAQRHQQTNQQVLPLALNLASLLNALRHFSRIKTLTIVAPTITSGGLHELAYTLDQALVTIACGNQALTPAASADLLELQQAGAMLWTSKRRTLGAHLLQIEFEQAALAISGSSDISATDFHQSLELDTLTVAPRSPYATWLASLMPMLVPLVPSVQPVAKRSALLSKPVDALANFKAQVAMVKDADTHQRLSAWLTYRPQPPVAMQLGNVAYFALAFPQYQSVVIDTFTPNNALFFARGKHPQRLAQTMATATSKRELQALGAKRAYHTQEPIRQRVQRILQPSSN